MSETGTTETTETTPVTANGSAHAVTAADPHRDHDQLVETLRSLAKTHRAMTVGVWFIALPTVLAVIGVIIGIVVLLTTGVAGLVNGGMDR